MKPFECAVRVRGQLKVSVKRKGGVLLLVGFAGGRKTPPLRLTKILAGLVCRD